MAIACCTLCGAGVSRAQDPLGPWDALSNPPLEGILEPWKTCSVACTEQGLLESVLVKPGDRVKAGDVVAELDMALSELQLAIADAQASATGRLQTVRAEVELAEKKVQSIQQAREKRYSTQSELDRAQADLKITLGRLKTEEDEARILALQAKRAEQLHRQRRVVCPIDGVIEKVSKSMGEFVSWNSPEVVRVVDVSKLRASFFLQLDEVATLEVGSKVQVELVNKVKKQAVVEHIAPCADGESGLIEVQVLVENPEMKILGSRCTLILGTNGHLTSRN